MHESDKSAHSAIMTAMLLFSLAFIIAGVFCDDMATLPARLYAIFTCPAPLVTDYTAVGGLNGALVNAGLMGLCVYALYHFSGFLASGGAFGAFFLSLGIGLFGKTPLTLAPFVLGGWLYAKQKHEAYSRIIQYPIQAAALSPVVSVIAFQNGFSISSLIGALAVATFIGFIITPVASHTRTMHRGFDLYNVGLAAGLVGICFFAMYQSLYLAPNHMADSYHIASTLGPNRTAFFLLFLGGLFILEFLTGYFMAGRKLDKLWLLRYHTGLDIDFVPEFGISSVFMNMGMVGLMMLAYFWIIRAPFNGATIGAMICVLCWTGNGANTRNILPILAGYTFASWLMETPLNTQYLCIAVCYATGLAPVSGRYGGICGILAGLIHAFLAGITASMHGGFNLYNGGFTAGMTALVLYPIVQNLSPHEYMDSGHEKHPGLVAELAHDAVHLAEGAAQLVALDHDIVHTLPEDHHESKTEHTFLEIRNTFVALAGCIFVLSVMPTELAHSYGHILKFAAYILGAGAYGSEIILLTDGFRRNPGIKEMFMPYIFGVLYIVLGLSYLLATH